MCPASLYFQVDWASYSYASDTLEPWRLLWVKAMCLDLSRHTRDSTNGGASTRLEKRDLGRSAKPLAYVRPYFSWSITHMPCKEPNVVWNGSSVLGPLLHVRFDARRLHEQLAATPCRSVLSSRLLFSGPSCYQILVKKYNVHVGSDSGLHMTPDTTLS
ncbi:hypothetical protein BDY19DRAFT_72125 [Irpex rosettiformis]|uniref:Uncharacterized protein n=1 Tax=Irpex rosettiformis TaxID=378272 RepID=A0ACB8ULN1_9APHY|nr:hypothetical protein BDY19DRAFT_72125 [Irpex rosettiformis]